MLPSQRHLFDVPRDIAYLNCAYMSPQLLSVREAGEKALSLKSEPWKVKPQDFFEESEIARELFARLCGGESDGVSIVPSVSYGIAVATANLAVKKGQNILVLDEQFPSNVYPWRDLARERGANLITVPRPVNNNWTAALLDFIDENTAVVAAPNCHWTDGSLVDLVRVGAAVREIGAALVVDATQSLGAYPLDVSEVEPDFLVSAGYKWMLGPYSLGFMYVGETRRDGKPIEQNWIVRERSEDFARVAEYRDGFQPGARRYDVGERSNFVLMPMATTAMRQILDWGVGNISETIGFLTDHIEKAATKLGLESTSSDYRARHMIGLRLGPDAPQDLAARLAAENVFVSVRGNSLRVSPHLYNDERDVDRLFEVLSDVL